jgi:hypothetical protein
MIYKILGGITLLLALLVLGGWNFHTTVRTERTFNARFNCCSEER